MTVGKMANSIPAIYQNDVSYTKDSQAAIKDLPFMSSESQKERKKYLKYFDDKSIKNNTALVLNVCRENIYSDYIIKGKG